MKRIIERISSTAMLAVAFMLCATSAWAAAPTPVAEWNWNFKKNIPNYSLLLNDNTDRGTYIDITSTTGKGVSVDFSTAMSAVTVIVKYSNLLSSATSSDKLLATSCVESSHTYDRTGVRLTTTPRLRGCANNNTNTGTLSNYGGESGVIESSGYMAFIYCSDGTSLYTNKVGAAAFSAAYNNTSIKYGGDFNSGASIYGVTIAGARKPVSGWTAAKGMKIEAIAVFNSALTTAQMNEFSFKSEAAMDGSTITGGDDVCVNLSGGAVSVSGNTTATALLVLANTTLDFGTGGKLTVNGPIYIADACTLTINASNISEAEDRELLTAGTVSYDSSQIVSGTVSGGAVYSDVANKRVLFCSATNSRNFTSPSASWTVSSLPATSYTIASGSGTISFANNPSAQTTVNDEVAVVSRVAGGSFNEIDGYLSWQQTGATTSEVYLMVDGGASATRINGAGEFDYEKGTRTLTGNVLVNMSGHAAADFVMGGYKGGSPTSLTGDIGIVIEENAIVNGTVIGGWSSVHNYKPLITGNTYVLVKNVQTTTTSVVQGSTPVGYIIGGSAYQGNYGGSEITGNASVAIDLDNSATGTFVKNIIGGSYGNSSKVTEIGGSTSVSITSPNAVTFSGNIIGGCKADSGGASVAGNSSVTLDGGTYTGTIYAGSFGSGTPTVAGSATLTLNCGTFSGATLKAGTASGAKSLVIGGDIDLSGATINNSGFDGLSVVASKTLTLGTQRLIGATDPTLTTIGDGGKVSFSLTSAEETAKHAVLINCSVADMTGKFTILDSTGSDITSSVADKVSVRNGYLVYMDVNTYTVTIGSGETAWDSVSWTLGGSSETMATAAVDPNAEATITLDGGTLVISDAETFAGKLTIAGTGTLKFTGNATLTSDLDITIGSGVTLDFSGLTNLTNMGRGDTIISAVAITVSSSSVTFPSTWTCTSSVTAAEFLISGYKNDSDSISINIIGGYPGGYAGKAIASDAKAGYYPVLGANWIQIADINQQGGGTVNVTETALELVAGADAVTEAGLVVNATANNLYMSYQSAVGANAYLMYGYLDDGGSGAGITVSNIPYSEYAVLVYMGTDQTATDKAFRPVTVNGTAYCANNGITDAGSSYWGSYATTHGSVVLEEGSNFLKITGQTGSTLTVQGATGGDGYRCGIAGIQIINTGTRPPIYAATLSGTEATLLPSGESTGMTKTSGGSWSGDTTAKIILTNPADANSTVTIGENITTGSFKIKGAGTVTLAKANGMALTINGGKVDLSEFSGTLCVDSSISQTLFAGVATNGGTVRFLGTNLSFEGAASLPLGRVAFKSATLTGDLQLNNRTIVVEDGDAVILNGNNASRTSMQFAISGGSLTVKGDNFWFGNGSTFTQTGGTVTLESTSTSMSDSGCVIFGFSSGGGTVNISGGTFDMSNATLCLWTGTTSLTLSGNAVFKVKGIWSNASKNVTVGGSSKLILTGTEGIANSLGSLTMNGGTIELQESAEIKKQLTLNAESTIMVAESKTATLSGGVTGTGTLKLDGAGTIANSTALTNVSAIDFTKGLAVNTAVTLPAGAVLYVDDDDVTIGGAVTQSGSLIIDGSEITSADPTDTITITAASGTFTVANVSTQNMPGSWTLDAANSTATELKLVASEVATVGETGYATIAAAIAAANSGATKTVTLTSNTGDSSTPVTIPEGVTVNFGSYTLTCGTLTVGSGVVVNMANISASKVEGSGTVIYDGSIPTTGLGWVEETWSGTLWIKGATITDLKGADLGSSASTLRLTGVSGYAYYGGDTTLKYYESPCTIDLQDDGATKAFTLSNGYGDYRAVFKALTGAGTFQGDSHSQYYIFKDASAFEGSLTTYSGGTRIILGNATSLTVGAGTITVPAGYEATIKTGKTWSAPGGITVSGTLKVEGSGSASANLTTESGATLDLSAYTGETPAITGTLTLADGVTLKLPAGTKFPYQIASSGTTCIITGSYTIGGEAGTASGLALTEDGYLDAANVATITTDTVLSNLEAGGKYLYNVTANATVDVSGVAANVGIIQFSVNAGVRLKLSGEPACPYSISGDAFAIASGTAETATVRTFTAGDAVEFYSGLGGSANTGNGAISSTYTKIAISNLSSLTLGDGEVVKVYTLARWTTPQRLSTGYGRVAELDKTGLAAGLDAELVYCADRICLKIFDAEALAARGTIKIWPYGDSITEGYNSSSTRANYRVLLAQKLSMLGYNVEMVGCFDKIQAGSMQFPIDPSGETAPEEWRWHSAKHGGTVGVTSATSWERSSMIESVDTHCAQIGKADVVLLHGGINDLYASGQTAQSVFDNLTNVVTRIITDMPEAKVVVSTLLYGDAIESNRKAKNSSHVEPFNNQLKTLISNPPASWVGRVVLADLNAYVGTLRDDPSPTWVTADHLHPDWWGHDQMAEGWLAKITELYAPTATFPSATALPTVAASELGAASKDVLDLYRRGYRKYGTLEVGQNVLPTLETVIPYTDGDSKAASAGIGKVAYFVEYVRDDNNSHKWVWADMDAFGTTIGDVGLPLAIHQCVVNNLHVYSNHEGIENILPYTDGVDGWIEFTPFDYAGGVSNIEGAPTAHGGNDKTMFDWNDNLAGKQDSGTYGGMQVFRKSPSTGRPAQLLFAYNNFRTTSTQAEFGIGNFSQHFTGNAQTLDYTYTANLSKMNASAYRVKNIEIWTRESDPDELWYSNDKRGTAAIMDNVLISPTGGYATKSWITIPGDGMAVVKSIVLGSRTDGSYSENSNNSRIQILDGETVVATSGLINGNGITGSTDRFCNGAYRQTFQFDTDTLLTRGKEYRFKIVDSSGTEVAWPSLLEREAGALSYSVITNNNAFNVLFTQEVNVERVYDATLVAGDNTFSGLTFSPTIAAGHLASQVMVTVPESTTSMLAFDSATTVGTIRFSIPSGSTLTVDPANLTAGKIIVYGTGTLKIAGSITTDIEVFDDATFAFGSGESLAITGNLTVASGKTLTLEPDTPAATSQQLVTAASISGEIALTAPDESSDYSIVTTSTAVTLRRTTKAAFTYNPVPGDNTPAGWITSWGGNAFATTSLRVGPTSAIPYVYHVSDNAHPYYNLSPRNDTSNHKVSCAVYVNVSQMASSGKQVIASFGNQRYSLIMYREGDAVKVGRVRDYSFVSGAAGDASITIPNDNGYHLWTFTCEFKSGSDTSDKTIALYLDDGVGVGKSSSNTAIAHDAVNLNGGFSIGSVYDGVPTGFSVGVGLAVCAVRGYDVALKPEEVAVIAESFPATDGTISWDVNPDVAANTSIITTASVDDTHYLGITKGTMTIPAGSTVTISHFRAPNSSDDANAVTNNIEGTLIVRSPETPTTEPCVWYATSHGGEWTGLLFGHWAGSGIYNIPTGGAINGPDVYLQTVYTAGAQTINITGGTVNVKGLYAYQGKNNSTVNLSNGGVLQVKEIPTAAHGYYGGEINVSAGTIAYNFADGTYRLDSDGPLTVDTPITFSGTSANPTVIDPYGNTITMSAASLNGTPLSYITVTDSSDGKNGKVVFPALPANTTFSGWVILDDANAGNIDISSYNGKVAVRGRALATLKKLEGFGGIAVLDASLTYDAREVDLSGVAIVLNNAGATLKATAGKEGVIDDEGGNIELYLSNDQFLTEGYIFTGGIRSIAGTPVGTLTYYYRENLTSETLNHSADDLLTDPELSIVRAGNSIAPYYRIFCGAADGTSGNLSNPEHWERYSGETAPVRGNMAVHVTGGKTLVVTIDNEATFGEVQVFGSGTVVFEQSGNHVMTVDTAKGFYATSGTQFSIVGGVVGTTPAEGVRLHALDVNTVAQVDCGTVEAPFVVAYAGGAGTVKVGNNGVARFTAVGVDNFETAGAAYAPSGDAFIVNASLTVGATGTLNLDSTTFSGSFTDVTVASGGQVSLTGTASLAARAMDLSGTVTVAATASLDTPVTGTGRVEYTGKLPDSSSWSTGTTSAGWRGTVAVSNYSSSEANPWYINDYGNEYSTLEVDNCYAYYLVKSQDVTGPTLKLVGAGLRVANGNGGEQTIFKALSGTGPLTKEGVPRHCTNFGSSPDFSGSITNNGRRLVFGTSIPANTDAAAYSITIDSNYTVSLGNGATWKSNKINISGILDVKGAGRLEGAVTLNSGATLKFDNIGTSEEPKKLTLSSTLNFTSGTVNIAFGEGATLRDGATLIDWTIYNAIPAGTFALTGAAASDWVLLKTATGLKLYSAKIQDIADVSAGTISVEGNALVATVEPTGAAVSLNQAVSKLVVSVTANALADITAPGVAAGNVSIKYGSTTTTGAYAITLDGTVFSFDINTTEGAAVNGVKVKPETADVAPMTVSSGVPTFKVKAIPGLYYAVKRCADPAFASGIAYGTAVQATTDTVSPSAPALGGGDTAPVYYYKIAVGASAADVQ